MLVRRSRHSTVLRCIVNAPRNRINQIRGSCTRQQRRRSSFAKRSSQIRCHTCHHLLRHKITHRVGQHLRETAINRSTLHHGFRPHRLRRIIRIELTLSTRVINARLFFSRRIAHQTLFQVKFSLQLRAHLIINKRVTSGSINRAALNRVDITNRSLWPVLTIVRVIRSLNRRTRQYLTLRGVHLRPLHRRHTRHTLTRLIAGKTDITRQHLFASDRRSWPCIVRFTESSRRHTFWRHVTSRQRGQ
mmetsp:Transcript_32353/g.52387  ORF Transcript_32353/g.52387 Transcript_32353/m.52387 type:complete len:246 (+) Transcript_32353:687-1424(+)